MGLPLTPNAPFPMLLPSSPLQWKAPVCVINTPFPAPKLLQCLHHYLTSLTPPANLILREVDAKHKDLFIHSFLFPPYLRPIPLSRGPVAWSPVFLDGTWTSSVTPRTDTHLSTKGTPKARRRWPVTNGQALHNPSMSKCIQCATAAQGKHSLSVTWRRSHCSLQEGIAPGGSGAMGLGQQAGCWQTAWWEAMGLKGGAVPFF